MEPPEEFLTRINRKRHAEHHSPDWIGWVSLEDEFGRRRVEDIED